MAGIRPDQLAQEMVKTVAEYTQDVRDGIDELVDEVAKRARSTLRKTSPKRTRKYAKGWVVQMTRDRYHTKGTVWNRKYYNLVHLLEHGHAKVGGGRVEAIPHVKPVEQEAIAEFEMGVVDVIKKGGKK